MSPTATAATLLAIVFIATSSYTNLTRPGPYGKKTMTDQTTLTIGQPPATLAERAAALDGAMAALRELLDSRIRCTACFTDYHQARALGTPEDELPPVNAAQLIVPDAAGRPTGACLGHVQTAAVPPTPGRLPSGVWLPGQAG